MLFIIFFRNHFAPFSPETLSHAAPPKPFPPRFREVWDNAHVLLPCYSDPSRPGRWGRIAAALSQTIVRFYCVFGCVFLIRARAQSNADELIAAILSYNRSRVADAGWNFAALGQYLEDFDPTEHDLFFSHTLPTMQALVLQHAEIIPAPIPLLAQNVAFAVTLSQQQVWRG